MEIARVYITNSNFRKIISKIDLSKVPDNILDGRLHDTFNIEFFNKSYIKRLLAFKYFIQNAEEIDLYEKIEIRKDTYTYLVENESKPSYHLNATCIKLNSKFENLYIPPEIHNLGEQKIIEFRDYILSEFGKYEPKRFKELEQLIITKINFKFGVELKVLNFVSEDYSGSQLQANPTLEELDREIEALIIKFQEACKRNTPIFPKFAQRTFLWRKPEEINYFPYQWYTKEEFIAILKEFDLLVVERTAELLREYYKVKFNKDLCFNGLLLEQLNFKSCAACMVP